MKRLSTLALPVAAAMLAACQGGGTAQAERDIDLTPPADDVAYARLMGAEGQMFGRAVLTDVEGGVRVEVALENLPVTTHAVHIHETGACAEPDFTSAGGHWNPTNEPHPQHKGDLGNAEVGADGRAQLSVIVSGVSLASGDMPMLDADGAALIVHEMADDMMTQPTGAAGPRLACSAITLG